MKIVILDGYTENPGDLSWNAFQTLGEITYYDRSSDEEIISRVQGAEALIINKAKITKEVMDACPTLKYIGVLATGYDVIDIEEAKKRNIAVCNVPGYGTKTVSQFAIAMLLEICSQVGYHSNAVRNTQWAFSKDWCFWDKPLIELDQKTLGIIGFGRIGQATAQIALALGMNIVYYDEFVQVENINYKSLSLDDLLGTSDVIALHCPLTKDNENLINKKTIKKMKKGVILLNNARGKLINEEDLAQALQDGKVFAAALDVVQEEPIALDNSLMKCDNCYITPHISWATKEARARIMQTAANNLLSFMRCEKINRII